jgi:peptidase M28-like protein
MSVHWNRPPWRAALAVRGLPILLFVACSGGGASGSTPAVPPAPAVTPAEVSALLSQLADDSLRGRMTAMPGSAKAAAIIAREMRRAGLRPAGDSGFFQRVPFFLLTTPSGRLVPALPPSFAARDTFPADRRRTDFNVLGVLPGADSTMDGEYILVAAHHDHLGAAGDPVNACRPLGADSICNGADDDASGVVAVLEIARELARQKRPRRTVLFASMTGEELGLLGTRWFMDHPPRPLERLTANLAIEMIGRPDSLAGGPGRAWLTGSERSTMGEMFAAADIPIVPDPYPAQEFFQRSDNYAFAERGIVAHTLASYNLHTDYHRPSDEAARTDAAHMAAVIQAATRAVRLLADGPRPEWTPGGRPEPPTRRP